MEKKKAVSHLRSCAIISQEANFTMDLQRLWQGKLEQGRALPREKKSRFQTKGLLERRAILIWTWKINHGFNTQLMMKVIFNSV